MRVVRLSLLAALAAGAVPAAAAQSLLYRTPNLSGTWVPAGGVLQFNFLHRFTVSDAATNNTVTNYPTFTFALGVGKSVALGTMFATKSVVVPGAGGNEFELYGRIRLGVAEGEPGVSLAVTPAYNTAAESVDGEVSVDWTRGRFTLSGAGRAMSDARGQGAAGFAAAAGATIRLNDYVAIDGDIAQLFSMDGDPAWSAGLSFLIPGSPHTFSLHASTTTSTTIQGSSVSVGEMIYGFEFTIPIHFSRFAPWFAKAKKDSAVFIDVPFMNATGGRIEMRNNRFGTDSVTITAGQSVGWINRDEVVHTVTFESSGAQSSANIAARGTHVVTFARPGVYRYHCEPHPNMKGVVVVR